MTIYPVLIAPLFNKFTPLPDGELRLKIDGSTRSSHNNVSVFAAAFSGSANNLLDLTVPNTLPWAQVFLDVQTTVNEEIRNIFSCGNFTVLRELEAVDACVKKLSPLLQDGVGTSERESFKNSVSDLRITEEKLAQGLDDLSKFALVETLPPEGTLAIYSTIGPW
ncbi:hypothetical protein V6N12_059330 [Hibiscus sabdariffa]